MKIFLIVIAVVLGGFMIWQAVLLVRDIIAKVKSKKTAKDNSAVENTANDERKE